MALKTGGSSRVTPSVCFSVYMVSKKCRYKTLTSKRCPSWFELPRRISHVRNDITPSKNPPKLCLFKLQEVHLCPTWSGGNLTCFWLVPANLLKSRACLRSNAGYLKRSQCRRPPKPDPFSDFLPTVSWSDSKYVSSSSCFYPPPCLTSVFNIFQNISSYSPTLDPPQTNRSANLTHVSHPTNCST